jgi:hypothetical protein
MKYFITLLFITILSGCVTGPYNNDKPYPTRQELYEQKRVDPTSYLGRLLRDKGY